MLREAVRMLEFLRAVEVRRGKEGGLAVASMNPAGTIGSATLYLSFAGVRQHQAVGLAAAAGPERREPKRVDRALELFVRFWRPTPAPRRLRELPRGP